MKKWLLLLLLPFSCLSQHPLLTGSGVDWRNTSSSSGPLSVPGLKFWWVSSDLPLNVKVTNWVDRISGSVWTNGADSLRPTNSSQGVFFWKSAATWLTNNLDLVVSNKTSCMMVFRPYDTNSTGSFQRALDSSDDANQYGFEGNGRFALNANLWYILNTNNMVDTLFVIQDTSDTANRVFYTNNVNPGITTTYLGVGTKMNGLNGNNLTIGSFRGAFQLLEFMWWTNNIVTNLSWRLTLHNYVTNTYPYITP